MSGAGVPEGNPMNLALSVWMKKTWNQLLLLLAWSTVAEVTLTGRGSKEQFLSPSSSLAVSLYTVYWQILTGSQRAKESVNVLPKESGAERREEGRR